MLECKNVPQGMMGSSLLMDWLWRSMVRAMTSSVNEHTGKFTAKWTTKWWDLARENRAQGLPLKSVSVDEPSPLSFSAP